MTHHVTTHTVVWRERSLALPTLTIRGQDGRERAVIKVTDIVEALATAMGYDTNDANQLEQLFAQEEELARQERMTDARELRPPHVPLSGMGLYRALPLALPADRLREAALALAEKFSTREGLRALSSNIDELSYKPVFVLPRRFFVEQGQELAAAWGYANDMAEEMATGLIATLNQMGYGPDKDPHFGTEGPVSAPILIDHQKAADAVRAYYLERELQHVYVPTVVHDYVCEGLERRYYSTIDTSDLHREVMAGRTGLYSLIDMAIVALLSTGRYRLVDKNSNSVARNLAEYQAELGQWLKAEDVERVKTVWEAMSNDPGGFVLVTHEFNSLDQCLTAVQRSTRRVLASGQRYIAATELADVLTELEQTPITQTDIHSALSDKNSALLRAFTCLEMDPYYSNLSRREYEGPTSYGHFEGYTSAVRRYEFSDDTCKIFIRAASEGRLPVYISTLQATDSGSVIQVSLFGARETVTAAFASLFVNQGRGALNTLPFAGLTLYPMPNSEYKSQRGRVPGTRNVVALTLVAKSAIPELFDPTETYFYLLTTSPRDHTPEHFLPMLDRAIDVPLQPEWSDHLWQQGLLRGLIQPLKYQMGLYGFRIRILSQPGMTSWIQLVAEGLQTHAIQLTQETQDETRRTTEGGLLPDPTGTDATSPELVEPAVA